MTPLALKEEFEKAYEAWDIEQHKASKIIFRKDCARWAAKWMTERCAKHFSGTSNLQYDPEVVDEILQLAKELE